MIVVECCEKKSSLQMASLVQKIAIAFLLIFTAANSISANRLIERFSRSEGRTLRDESVERHKRESASFSDSVQCSKISGMFEERMKEEKFQKEFTHEVHLSGDSKGNLQLAWTGDEFERIIVVTSEFGASSIYVSENHGKDFKNITSVIDKSDQFDELTLQKHTNDSKTVYLVANTFMAGNSVLYVSMDSAATFKRVQLDFKMDSSVIFHSSKPDYMLALDGNYPKSLHLSQDKGLTWNKIKSNVVFGRWGSELAVDSIYIMTNNNTISTLFDMMTSNARNDLERSTDFGANWKKLRSNVYTFGTGNKFLYASIFKEAYPNDDRFLVVSTDCGDSWNNVRLPSITPERFYSILESEEGVIFLHSDHPGDTGRGTLYTSDATGIIFSESLQNHLYPNFEDLTDFYKVQSMRGVYIASQLMPDDSIHTVMTFDRGGEWQSIKRPEGVACKDEAKECYLQIHNLYSIKRGIRADPPLSIPNAPGLILVHGHVADALQTTDPDVFVSTDGGYQWRLALKGPHHYQIADHGSLLVAVPSDTDTPSLVKFSTDEGHCWISYNFTEKKIVYTGILIEPGNRDMTVAIWGYTDDRTWHTHIINFTAVIDKQCDSSDYEEWIPHQHNDDNGCLLGQKETFRRIKKDSWCYNGKAYQVEKSGEPCKCTADDFSCDYGYKRVGETCVKDTSVEFEEVNICLRGHEEKFVPMGYHKIPGDKCVDGFLPPEAKLVNLNEVCSDDSPSAASDPKQKETKNRQTALVLTAMFAILFMVLVIILVTYLGRKYKFFRQKPTYRYSSIRCDDDIPIVVAKQHGTSLFEDSSDEEVREPKIHVIPNGKRANGQAVANGHIPSSSVVSSVHQSATKNKAFDSDDDEMLST